MAATKAELTIPETAVAVKLRVVPTPTSGGARLLRWLADRDPLVVTGSHTEVWLDLREPRTIYYEFLPGTEHIRIFTLGWRDPRGKEEDHGQTR